LIVGGAFLLFPARHTCGISRPALQPEAARADFRTGSGADEGGASSDPEGQHRQRDRRAFGTLDHLQARALLLVPDAFFSSRQEQLLALAARQAIPAIYRSREWTEAGGLISYGTNLVAAFHLVGIYAGRVLKGEKPADLPVQ
jgi:hypothetical protein